MTIEVVDFKCPYCGHLLGQEEARVAQIKKDKEIDEKVNQKVVHQIEQIHVQHVKEIKRLQEKNQAENERVIFTRVQDQLNEIKKSMEVKYRKELDEKEQQIRAAKVASDKDTDEKIRIAINENEEKYRQREKEREIHNDRIEADNRELMERVEKLQKTLDNIPQELRGTASEFVLSEELKKEFPLDDIRTKKVGVAMADVIQNIITNSGERLPNPIIYDRKTGESITKVDILKAKNYKSIHNTEYSIIVTEKGIKDNRLSEEREGILIVHPRIILDIAKRIRGFVIEFSKLTQCNKGRETKQARLYDYFTSAEYYRDFKETDETKRKIDELQRKEEDYHKTMWNRRKEYVEKWFEIEHKNERMVSDITQDDLVPDAEEKEEPKEDEFDSSS